MRKVTLGLANSLDNYIARKDGGFDWIHWGKEVAEISAKFMKTICSNAGSSKAATWPFPIGSSAELFSTTRMHFCTGLLRRKSTR